MVKSNKPNPGETFKTGMESGNPETMEQILDRLGLTAESITRDFWEPKPEDFRLFIFQGEEIKKSSEGEYAGTEFTLHLGKDIKTKVEFAFLGGGLFSYLVKEKNIQPGQLLFARFKGMVEIDGNRRARQWEIKRIYRAGEKPDKVIDTIPTDLDIPF